jgi:hypothetical protein
MPPPTTASRIRAARKRWPTISQGEIARRLDCTPQEVSQALHKVGTRRGRPPGPMQRVQIPRELYDAVRAEAERTGVARDATLATAIRLGLARMARAGNRRS